MVSPLQPRNLTPQPWRNSLQPCKGQQELGRSALRHRSFTCLQRTMRPSEADRACRCLHRPSIDKRALARHSSFPHVPLVPARRAYSSAPGTWRRVTMPAPLPASQRTMPPRGTPAAPGAPHHLCAEGLRVLDLAELAPSCRTLGARSSWKYVCPVL